LGFVEDFLISQYFEKNQLERDFALLEELKFRNIDDLFLKRIERMKRIVTNQNELFSFDGLGREIKLNNLIVNHSILNDRVLHEDTILKQFETINRSNHFLAIQYYIERVNRFVLIEIFKKTCNIKEELVSNNVQGILLDMPLRNNFQNNPSIPAVIELYESLFNMFYKFDDETLFDAYKNKLKLYGKFLDVNELKSHYLNIVSYLIIKKNCVPESQTYSLQLWRIYEIMLKNNLLIEEKSPYLDINLFRSILFLGLKLKLFEETKNFIDSNSRQLNPSDYLNMLHLSHGYLRFELTDYEKALEYIAKIDIDDFIYKYDIKNLQIKIYFELGCWESLTSSINSYKEFLRNDEVLNNSLKTKIKLFLSYIEFLAANASKIDQIDLSFQIRKLQSENIYGKEWLISKYSSYLRSEYKYA
jgi:hypothetical protein